VLLGCSSVDGLPHRTGVTIRPQVAAAVGCQLPPRAMVAAAKARIEAELAAEAAAAAAADDTAKETAGGGVRKTSIRGSGNGATGSPGVARKLGSVRRMTSGGRLRDLDVDIDEDGPSSMDEFEDHVFEDGQGGYARLNADGVLDIEAEELGPDSRSQSQAGSYSDDPARRADPDRTPTAAGGEKGSRTWGQGWASSRSRPAVATGAAAEEARRPAVEVEVAPAAEGEQRGVGARRRRGVPMGRSRTGAMAHLDARAAAVTDSGRSDGSETAPGAPSGAPSRKQ
jgi:hypothetical protein